MIEITIKGNKFKRWSDLDRISISITLHLLQINECVSGEWTIDHCIKITHSRNHQMTSNKNCKLIQKSKNRCTFLVAKRDEKIYSSSYASKCRIFIEDKISMRWMWESDITSNSIKINNVSLKFNNLNIFARKILKIFLGDWIWYSRGRINFFQNQKNRVKKSDFCIKNQTFKKKHK